LPPIRSSAVRKRRASHAVRFVGASASCAARGHLGQGLAERRCELLTIVGDPASASRGSRRKRSTDRRRVVRGRCSPYGEGITYWPVIEVVKQLDVRPDDEHAATIRSLLGETEHAGGTEQIAWAFRKLLERRRRWSSVFDDIQWGEETFLDLIESTALLSSGAPLCSCAWRGRSYSTAARDGRPCCAWSRCRGRGRSARRRRRFGGGA
jgi:hypothetical protein